MFHFSNSRKARRLAHSINRVANIVELRVAKRQRSAKVQVPDHVRDGVLRQETFFFVFEKRLSFLFAFLNALKRVNVKIVELCLVPLKRCLMNNVHAYLQVQVTAHNLSVFFADH